MVKFEIDLLDKKIIGQLLRFYRIYTKRTQKDMIINEYGNQICSRKTLSLIESGELIALDIIYEELLYNLRLRYNYDRCIDEWYDEFSTLLHYCEYYDIDHILHKVSSILDTLDKYKDYIIFHEAYILCKIIKKYYAYHVFPDKNTIQYISGIHRILDLPLNEIMIDLLFKGCVRNEIDYEEYYNFSQAKNIINKMNYLITMIYDAKHHLAIEYSLDLKRELSATNNHIRLLDLYNIKMTLYKNAEKDEFLSLVSDVKEILNNTKHNIPVIKKAQTCKNLAISAYKLNLLEIAEKEIINFLQYDKRETTPYLVILIDIYQRSDKYLCINDIMICLKHKICGNKYDIYMNYFIYKYKYMYEPNKLNDYIMTEILNNLHNSDTIYARIFYRELDNLTKITKRYKDTKVFVKRIKDLLDFQV